MRILDPLPSRALLVEALRRARDMLPGLRGAPVQAEWAGHIDSSPDGVPVLDGDIGLPGRVLAAGLSGHGFGIGPGVGHLVADLVLADTPLTEVGHERLDRFGTAQGRKVAEF